MSSLDTGQYVGLHVDERVKVPTNDLINQESTSTPSQQRHISQSDSGISLNSLSQDSVLSPQQTEPIYDNTVIPETGLSHLQPIHSVNPQDPTQNGRRNSVSPRSTAKHLHVADCSLDESRNLKHGKSSGRAQPDKLSRQTKYFVLQFLHQSMNEESLLHLSHSSVSATSESEPRFISHAARLRQQWQDSRSHSQSSLSPSPSNHLNLKSRPRSKSKVTKSSHEVNDVNCFKDVSQQNKSSRNKRVMSAKTAEVTKYQKSSKLSRQRAVEVSDRRHLIRSISENSEGSEHRSYLSDADDELDGSFNSSQQGSVTSHCFRERLAHFHHHQHTRKLSSVKNQTDFVTPLSHNLPAEESVLHAADDESASSILSLDMINIEPQPVSPTTQHARVSDYLLQMSQMSVESFSFRESAPIDWTDLDLKYLDDAAEETHRPQNDISPTGSDSEQLLLFNKDLKEDGVLSRESDQETSDDEVENVDMACGGVNADETDQISGGNGWSSCADHSQLRLDLSDHQDAALLIDVAHSLQQDIEEEMFTLESEFEESGCLTGRQSVHSDHCHTRLPNLNGSSSLTPEAAEAVRILARIGDEVQQRHFQDLDRAVSKLLIPNCAGLFTYENFCEAAPKSLGGDMDQWKQIATLLLYSQHVALRLGHGGRKGLNKIVDYTVRMLADNAADFIVKQAGMFEQSSTTPSSPDHPGPVLSPFLDPFISAATTSTATTTSTTTNSLVSSQHTDGVENHSTSPSAKAEQCQKLTQPIPDSEDFVVTEGTTEANIGIVRGIAEADLCRIKGITETDASVIEGTIKTDPSVIRGTIETDPSVIRSTTDPGVIRSTVQTDHSIIRGIIQTGPRTDPSTIRGVTDTNLNRIATESVAEGVEEVTLSTAAPGLEALSPASTLHTNTPENREQNIKGEEKQSSQPGDMTKHGEGMVSNMCSGIVNSGRLTRWVVSVGVLAVSAAFAFRFVRSG